MELARALMFGARVMQYLPNNPTFSDIAANTTDALIAESLKKEGVMGTSGATFGPTERVNRLEAAVAFVRALRLEAQAKALANTTVTAGGQPVIDNAQIPGALRGYVQIAIDRGVLEAFPAEVREVAPGQFQALPGPRFEPARAVKRGEFINPMVKVINILFGE
jgi:serine protease AprX